jgi:hypothetical protein
MAADIDETVVEAGETHNNGELAGAAFCPGFYAAVLKIAHHSCGPRLRAVEVALGDFADVLPANAYLVLSRTLERLRRMRTDILRPLSARSLLVEYPEWRTWSESRTPQRLPEAVRRWQDLSNSTTKGIQMDELKAGQPTIDFIKLAYAANRSPLLVGRHGVGKSELFDQAAKWMTRASNNPRSGQGK